VLRHDDIWSADGPDISVAYQQLRDRQYPIDSVLHDHIDHLWLKCCPLAERSFIPGFAHDPDARLWEMALACHFLDLGKEVLPGPQKDVSGPDLCLRLGEDDVRVWIEAVCPGNADAEFNQIPQGQNSGWAPVRELQLRLLGALKTKRQVFEKYIADPRCPVKPEDLMVIALSTGRFAGRGTLAALPDLAGCLLPIDGEYYQADSRFGDVSGPRLKFGKSVLKVKPDGVEDKLIDRAVFLSNEFQHISGVIFSRYGLYCGTECPHLTFFHNPHAAAPLPLGWAAWDQEYVVHLRDDGAFRLERLSTGANGG
jgi:hypothetical protein